MRLDPDLAGRFETVRDPHDAAAVLHAAGMCQDDISTIVLSRLHAIVSERGFAHER